MTSPPFDSWVERARSARIESFARHRGIVLKGNNERCGPCPKCGGADRFSINVAKQVFNCRQCGGSGKGAIDFVMFLDNADFNAACQTLTGEEPPPKPNGHNGSTGDAWRIEGEWVYHDADGKPHLKVVRKRKPDGGKSYPQYHLEDGQWVKGKPPGPKIPYRLPELLDSDRSEPVFIVEGEKCADRLAKEGVAVTSASEGAGKWTSDLNQHFADRIVWILPDADEPGRKHAQRVAANLHGIAREVRIVEISGLNAGQDVFDFLEGGGTGNDLRDLGERVPLWQPPPDGEGISQGPDGLSENQRPDEQKSFVFNPQPYQFPDPAKIPPRQWLYGRHYMRGVVSGTLGAPGRLKSTTILTEYVGMSVGRDLITGKLLESGPLRVAYFNGEETQDELDRRVAAIMQHYKLKPEDCGYKLKPEDPAERLWVVSTRDAPLRLAVMGRNGNAVINRPVVDAVTAWCDARSIDVFGADPLVSFHLARENDPGDMDLLYKEGFGHIAGKERRAVDLAIHPRKPSQGEINTSISDLRGTGAQEAALRIARVFNFMTAAEAAQLGIEEDDRRLYVKIDGGKGGPGPIAKANWVRIAVEHLPNGDDVALAAAWKPENPFTKVAQGDFQVVQRVAQGGAFRADSQSPKWLGWWMAENLPHLNIKTRHNEKPRSKAGKAEVAKLNQILGTWRENGCLYIIEREDENRKTRRFFDAELPVQATGEEDCATL